ncbi:hypothetical protein ABZ568_09850 [Streptomyces olindensis]|uniref:Uncharacterized protein n=1 Tax=Streptomyces olindensis TaxID=358823 RepID=A0ABV2XRT2_9ACTN
MPTPVVAGVDGSAESLAADEWRLPRHGADQSQPALLRAPTGAGLLEMGRRGDDRPLGPHLGPVTHSVVHHVGYPVAVVPHE